jgi:hypothetical protein
LAGELSSIKKSRKKIKKFFIFLCFVFSSVDWRQKCVEYFSGGFPARPLVIHITPPAVPCTHFLLCYIEVYI